MSKTIRVKVDGTMTTLSGVDKVQTDTYGTSAERWIPKDMTECGVLEANENSEYVAQAEGLYGYTQVNVMVDNGTGAELDLTDTEGHTSTKYVIGAAGSTSNYDCPGASVVWLDGERLMYSKVDSDGVIQTTEVPRYMTLTTPPTKRQYVRGESVDYTGAELTLYFGDGSVATSWGGAISYGSSTWTSRVVTETGKVEEVADAADRVGIFVPPFWYEGGSLLDKGYWLKVYYKVAISEQGGQ